MVAKVEIFNKVLCVIFNFGDNQVKRTANTLCTDFYAILPLFPRGKALFIEKPPCQSLDELAQLLDLQKAYDAIVEVGLQKRNSPIMRVLKKELKKSKASACYNLKYLTGTYPEGNDLLDLFIHPLDCMTYLFGEAQVKYAESAGGHTLMLILEHHCATGMLELSTGYSWNDAKEHWTINTVRGIYKIDQFDSLTFQPKPQIIMGIPMEKYFRAERLPSVCLKEITLYLCRRITKLCPKAITIR